MHSASTIYMGSHKSNVIESDNFAGAESTFLAGLCVCLDDDNDLDLAIANGSRIGISLGRSLSNVNKITVARRALRVPILLANGFTPTIGAQVAISDTTGKAVAYTGSGNSYVNAVYVSSTLTAYDEDGVVIADGAALIDFPGGL